MAQIDLGKLKFQWKGLWATSTAYEVDDVVHYDGTTYVVVTDVPATNTSEPGALASFDIMARGLNFRGAYDNAATYLHNEIVTSNSASWISIQSAPFTGQTPASGSAYWGLLTPAPASSVLTSPGDIVYRDNTNSSARLPIGTLSSTIQVIEQPNNSIARTINYSVGTATPATAIATDADNTSSTFGDNSANGLLTLSRGRSYVIVFPANGQTYSIKDPAASGYTTTGTAGQITAGVTPNSVSGGGSILFSPTSATPNSVKIRNEAGGTDELTVTVVDMALVPSWSGAALRTGKGSRVSNDFRNTLTESLLPIQQNKEFGRGTLMGSNPGGIGYRKGAILSDDGITYAWGNFYNNATQGNGYGAEATGVNINGLSAYVVPANVRLPDFFLDAVAGNAVDSKFLTDLNGNSLGYTTYCRPKIINAWQNRENQLCLTENGMIFKSGYGSFGSDGMGGTAASNYGLKYLHPHDESTSALTGSSRPKFKQVLCNSPANTTAVACVYGLTTDGEVFSMGDNGQGQLGQGNTTDNFYFRRIAQSAFGNEQVIYLYALNGTQGSVYAITETGKCYGWGDNEVGQLGLGNTTDQTTPQEITNVSGSLLNGKVITHVCGNSGTSDGSFAHVYFLTSEGEVFATGDAESFGQYLGVYRSDSANVTTPLKLTDSATGCNSDNQKVVSIWVAPYRYSTVYLITDGGDSNLVRMYATGNNTVYQQGTNTSTTSGASASAQGAWFMNEAAYQTATTTGSTDRLTRANVGTSLKVGDPCIVYTGGLTSTASAGWMVLLDSLGMVYVCAKWGVYNPVTYYELDSSNDFAGSSELAPAWTPLLNQPEPFKSFGFQSYTEDQESWTAVGVSGTCYTGGANNYSGNRGTETLGFKPFLLN